MAGAACASVAGLGWVALNRPRANAGKLLARPWGYEGIRPGNLEKPRGIAADNQDRLYIADMTDRIQVFSTRGEFLHFWRLPAFDKDGSTGLSVDRDGNLLVADTHFYRILVYSPQGVELRRIQSRPGTELGELGYLRDVIEDGDGYMYTCEYGEFPHRVQVISPDGIFIRQWGSYGTSPGQFIRPEALAFGPQGTIFVADCCNHRIQAFEKSGKLVDCWGKKGNGLGELYNPMDLAFDSAGDLYVCEWGNHRVQKFSTSGRSLGAWGGPGRRPGRLDQPWGLAVDRHDRVHVLDSGNHRVQQMVI